MHSEIHRGSSRVECFVANSIPCQGFVPRFSYRRADITVQKIKNPRISNNFLKDELYRTNSCWMSESFFLYNAIFFIFNENSIVRHEIEHYLFQLRLKYFRVKDNNINNTNQTIENNAFLLKNKIFQFQNQKNKNFPHKIIQTKIMQWCVGPSTTIFMEYMIIYGILGAVRVSRIRAYATLNSRSRRAGDPAGW